MKKTILTRRAGLSVALILCTLGTMPARGSAPSPVDWNTGDPVLQLHQRLAEQAPISSPAIQGVPVKDNPNDYPHKIDGQKIVKIIEKAGFYNGLHNGYYVFGVDGKRGEVVSSRDLFLSEKYEAVANHFARWPNSLINSDQVTKKVIIKSRNGRVQCSALIQHSLNSIQSPQVLANVSLYKCMSEQGEPRPEFHFTYTRLEVSRIMRGID